jgi:hypothetical protein
VASPTGGVAAQVEITDALSIQIYIEVQAGAPASVDSIDVKVSENGVDYTSIYSGSIGLPGSVTIPSVVPGTGRQLAQEISGWKSRYLMVVVYAAVNSNVKVALVSSIFSSSPMVSIAPYSTTNFYSPAGAASSDTVQSCTPQSIKPTSNDGVAVAPASEIWTVVTGHATNATNVEIWLKVGGVWGIFDSFALAAAVAMVRQIRGLGPERLAIRYTSADAPSAGKVKSLVIS